MTTHVESITAALQALLVGASTPAGSRIHTDIPNNWGHGDMPSVVVDIGNETPQPVFGQGVMYWELEVAFKIIAIGASPKLAPEATRAACHAALWADRTLGGRVQDINLGPVSRSISPDNPAAGETEAGYTIKYRAQEAIL